MKKLMCISYAMLITISMMCQNFDGARTYSNRNTSNLRLYLSFEKKTFKIVEFKNNSSSDILEEKPPLSSGTFSIDGHYIICKDMYSKKKYKFEISDNEKIKNCDMPYLENELFLIHEIKKNKKYPSLIGQWKNGKKNGYWRYFDETGIPNVVLYKDGVIVQNEKNSTIN